MDRMDATRSDTDAVLAAIEQSDRFLVQQVFKPIANEYRISVPPPGSTDEGHPLLFVKQKKMKIKEDIRFRLAPDDGPHLFMIKSRTVFEFRGRHEVLGPDGFDAHEASWPIALLRRFADLGPDWLAPLQWLPFNFVLKRDGQQVATYRRVLGKLRDRYELEIGPGLEGADRRLIIAFAVALDALQDR